MTDRDMGKALDINCTLSIAYNRNILTCRIEFIYEKFLNCALKDKLCITHISPVIIICNFYKSIQLMTVP